MPYFFSQKNLQLNSVVNLTGEEALHLLLSHRVKAGEAVKLQGPDGKRFLGEVVTCSKLELSVKITEELKIVNELPVRFTLFLSVVSEKAFDLILQKYTELGAVKICLFNSKNTAVQMSREIFNKKTARWNKIFRESAKQSERSKWPALDFLASLEDVVKEVSGFDKLYLADLSGRIVNKVPSDCLNIGLIVGPEGGFTKKEIEIFYRLKNLETIRLSPFVLKAETAAIAALSVLVSKIL